MKVKYARAPIRFSRNVPTFSRGGGWLCMEWPQPGQKAAESGIWAAQSGHDFNSAPICSAGVTISTRDAVRMGRNQFSALTRAIAKRRVCFVRISRTAANVYAGTNHVSTDTARFLSTPRIVLLATLFANPVDLESVAAGQVVIFLSDFPL